MVAKIDARRSALFRERERYRDVTDKRLTAPKLPIAIVVGIEPTQSALGLVANARSDHSVTVTVRPLAPLNVTDNGSHEAVTIVQPPNPVI